MMHFNKEYDLRFPDSSLLFYLCASFNLRMLSTLSVEWRLTNERRIESDVEEDDRNLIPGNIQKLAWKKLIKPHRN